jgi:hypothetical protein
MHGEKVKKNIIEEIVRQVGHLAELLVFYSLLILHEILTRFKDTPEAEPTWEASQINHVHLSCN